MSWQEKESISYDGADLKRVAEAVRRLVAEHIVRDSEVAAVRVAVMPLLWTLDLRRRRATNATPEQFIIETEMGPTPEECVAVRITVEVPKAAASSEGDREDGEG